MAKIFKGDVNFGFVINQTGAQPLDSRSVVQSYAELLKAETFGTAIYNGMTVATIDEQKVYMLVDKTKATVADGWKEIGAGGAVSVETYAEAVALATDENIGQVIYVKTKSSYDADGEGEGVAIEYDAAPYIVIGGGSLQKLAASTASGDIEGDVAELTIKVSGLETTVGDDASGLVKDVADLKDVVDALPETFVTDVKVGEASLVADGVADLSNFVQKDGDKVLSTNDYTTEEKNKLAGIAKGAEVNYVKSVGDNLNVDAEGKLTVTIPEVEVPFQSVAGNDKVLKLEAGVLSSGLSYAREEVEGIDSLVLKGIDGAVIGSVPVADFIADGMLESVAPKEEGSNIFVFTFNSAAGSKSFEVDFSKYVDTYNADGTTIELGANNTFSVKAGVFEDAGAAATVKSEIEADLANYAKSANVYSKTDADNTFVKSEGYVAYSNDEKTKLAGIAAGAQVNVLEGVQVNGVNLGISNKKVNIDLSTYAKSANVYSKEETNGLLTDKVSVEEGKGLSSNDFTDDLLTKLNGIATGAEVNVVKSVDTTGVLGLDASGNLSADLSAYITSESLGTTLTNYVSSETFTNELDKKADKSTLDSYLTSADAEVTYWKKTELVAMSNEDIINVISGIYTE